MPALPYRCPPNQPWGDGNDGGVKNYILNELRMGRRLEQREDGLYVKPRGMDWRRVNANFGTPEQAMTNPYVIFLTPEQCAEVGIPTCEKPTNTKDLILLYQLL